jgi:SHS2 domain-containing protein
MPFDYIDDIATADVAFEAWGDTVEEMFVAAADATMNVMVADLGTIAETEQRALQADGNADAVDLLLFDLLQELIFYKDAEQLLLRVKEVRIIREGDRLTLEADAYGEILDPEKHDLVVDVKAVTLHRFKVEKTPRGWEAMVILDI